MIGPVGVVLVRMGLALVFEWRWSSWTFEFVFEYAWNFVGPHGPLIFHDQRTFGGVGPHGAYSCLLSCGGSHESLIFNSERPWRSYWSALAFDPSWLVL